MFCNNSCSARFNNPDRDIRPDRWELKDISRKLRRDGWSYAVISEEMKLPISTIRNWVKDIHVDRISTQVKSLRRSRIPTSSLVSIGSIKKRIVEERGRKCEKCGLTEWMGERLDIEIHHIDGDGKNNAGNNLILLCPNCHSQTPDYRNRNHFKAKSSSDSKTNVQVAERETR